MEQILLSQHSSLEKILPDDPVTDSGYNRASALGGELFSYQIAVRGTPWGLKPYSWSLEAPRALRVQVYRVEQVPCGLAAYPGAGADGKYLSDKSGLFPDLLRPAEPGECYFSSFQNTVFWVDVQLPAQGPGTEYPLTFTVEGREGPGGEAPRAECVFTVKAVPAALPAQKLLFTQWFHVDCLASRYRVPVYSEAHWQLIENYLREAACHGMNTVLTPVLTPALDTEIGSQRPCVQLLDIEKDGETYRFGFARLERFVKLALDCGITHFEISHLFSQWGAQWAPNIYVTEQGERRLQFGWDTPADSPEYRGFVKQLVPAVIRFFAGMGLGDRIFLHVSDEPGEQHLERYRRHVELVASLAGDVPVIDALSSPAFYDQGLVRHPVAATDHIEPFLQRKVPGLWAYYCCAQGREVSNRFLAMPSYRNRILGLQLYKYGIAGFLHWGYNFWYSQNSREEIDPFLVTDGGGAFPGGDAFSVYPGEDGKPLPSLRMKVFFHGLQDLRALELLEQLAGREEVEKLIPGYRQLTFSEYSRDPPYLLELREKVNEKIEKILEMREK